MDLTDKAQLLGYLKENGLWAKHGLGQNFLIDKNTLEKILEAAEIQADDLVIEVGPGLGTLTEQLVEKAGRVVAVELDLKLAQLLYGYIVKLIESNTITIQQYNPFDRLRAGNLEIINADILKLNVPEVVADKPYKVVANIPYYITSKILQLFLTQKNKPESMVMLVQKEVAERICAKPGNMSVLAISIQIYGEPEIVDIVPKESFFPAPEVDSAILRIAIFKPQFSFFNQFSINNFQSEQEFEKDFFRCVHVGFASKRKTLANNLSVGFRMDKKQASDIISSIGLSENVRAQELSIQQWMKLTKELNDLN